MSTTPRSYVPPLASADAASMPQFTQRELLKVSQSLASAIALVPQVANAAPKQPIDGMQRLSVSPWRPVGGQVVDRWVTYHGGVWVYSASL